WASWAILAASPCPFAPGPPTPHSASDDGLSAWSDSDILVNHGDRLLATASDAIERQHPIVIAPECSDSGVGKSCGFNGCGLRLVGWAISTNPEVTLAWRRLGLGCELHAEPM